MSNPLSYARADIHRFPGWSTHDAQHAAILPFQQIMAWISRHRQRRALADVATDDRLLQDIGISPEAARREAAKPFWQ
jgi:uncharacterized protein YjiS (DUF1127 family)